MRLTAKGKIFNHKEHKEGTKKHREEKELGPWDQEKKKEFGTWDQELGTWDQELGTWDQELRNTSYLWLMYFIVNCQLSIFN